MDWKIELIVVPVTDVDRAKKFYGEQLGFNITVDVQNGDFRVVQAEPPGSGCSIAFGPTLNTMEPGALHGVHLIVNDIEAAYAVLSERGVELGPLHHFEQTGEQKPGVSPNRADYESFGSFRDPDGNSWVLQEIGYAK